MLPHSYTPYKTPRFPTPPCALPFHRKGNCAAAVADSSSGKGNCTAAVADSSTGKGNCVSAVADSSTGKGNCAATETGLFQEEEYVPHFFPFF
ncbi:MAG: hypothetical protein MJZ49_04980 [Bacteroidales bacterium]|nr:hypothetical protein [Bacteroidales bacterium]